MLYILPVIVLALVGLGLFASLLFRKVVDTDKVHVVQRNDSTTVYGPGLPAGNSYYAFPAWFPVIGTSVRVLPLGNIAINLDAYEAYDKGKVKFMVDVTSFVRIDKSKASVAASRIVDVETFIEQLTEVVQSTIRTTLAQMPVLDIMEQRNELGEKFTEQVADALSEWGATFVKNIELMDIRDAEGSKVISNIQAKKTSEIDRESRIVVAENQKAAEIAEIKAKKEADLADQQALEEVGKRTAAQEQQVGIAKEQSKQLVQEQAKLTAEKRMEVQRVEETEAAKIAKQVQITKAEEEAEERVIRAEAQKQADEQIAEGKRLAELKRAEAIAEVGKREAEVIKAKKEAEVSDQIALVTEIGESPDYMEHLENIEEIKANRDVGTEHAQALANADMKLISTDGKPTSLLDMVGPKGGALVSAALEAGGFDLGKIVNSFKPSTKPTVEVETAENPK